MKKILIFVAIGLITAGAVFTTLFLVNRITGYDDAKNYTDEILTRKSEIISFFDKEVVEDEFKGELSDEQKSSFDSLKQAISACDSSMKNIGESDVMRDEVVKAKYDEAKGKFENVRKVFDVESKLNDIMADGKISDEELKEFSESEDNFFKQLAADLMEYRKTVASFYEKYPEGRKISSSEKRTLDEDYAVVRDAGDKLSQKYEKISLENTADMKIDEFLAYFEAIEELNKILTEKM